MSEEEPTEQEQIALLGGSQVPDRDGFTFQGPPAKNGDIFDMNVILNSDGSSAGTARGTTRDEIIEHAQQIADEFAAD